MWMAARTSFMVPPSWGNPNNHAMRGNHASFQAALIESGKSHHADQKSGVARHLRQGKKRVIALSFYGKRGYKGESCMSMKYEQLEVCVLQSATPTAVLVTIFSVKYDADPFFCSAIVSLTTLVSMGSIPALFFPLK
jgi:hypothetical protein